MLSVVLLLASAASVAHACTKITENPAEQARSYSSVHDDHAPGTGFARSQLDSAQCWAAKRINGKFEGAWMMMDLGSVKQVNGVVVQGRQNANQWVKTLRVDAYVDNKWVTVVANAPANTDRNTKVEVPFGESVLTDKVRIHPLTYHSHASMRAGVLTCDEFCARPLNGRWCGHDGAKHVLMDCDGDGVADHTCSDGNGMFGVVQTSNGCQDTWPRGSCDCARPLNGRWCTHAGSKYVLQDCDGDGVADHTCSDDKGNFGAIQSALRCESTWPKAKGRCDAFSRMHDGGCGTGTSYMRPKNREGTYDYTETQASIHDCANLCKSFPACGFFYWYPGVQKSKRSCSLYTREAGCPDPNNNVEGTAYRLNREVKQMCTTSVTPQDFVFLIDSSGSVKQHNWDKSIAFVGDIIDSLPDSSRVGVIQFSTRAETWVAMTDDKDAVARAVRNGSSKYAGGGTNTKMALQKALQMLSGSKATKTAFLLTDGRPNDSPCGDSSLDNALKNAKVKLVTIAVGTFEDHKLKCLMDEGNMRLDAEFNALSEQIKTLQTTICEQAAVVPEVSPGDNAAEVVNNILVPIVTELQQQVAALQREQQKLQQELADKDKLLTDLASQNKFCTKVNTC